MLTQPEMILAYLHSIYPQGASNSDIAYATRIQSHQTVFMTTRKMMNEGKIRGVQGMRGEREWTFYAKDKDFQFTPDAPVKTNPISSPGQLTPTQFEVLAAEVLSQHYQTRLSKGTVPGVPKIFDLVSPDFSIVGDAKYFTMVKGEHLPPAKFSIIAEHVWLLEKTGAKNKVMVFGNDIEVSLQWLKRYGHLCPDISFYFLTDSGRLEELR